MKKLFTENDVKKILSSGVKEIQLSNGDILTPAAKDYISEKKVKINISNKVTQQATTSISKIAIGSDHTGVKVKKIVGDYLTRKKYDVIDVGTFTEDAVDYPDIAFNVAHRVQIHEVDAGIIIDATGIPSAITANKLKGIRAATCYNEFSARSSREHNNANIIVLGAKSLGEETIKSILDVWLTTNFLGERHQKRLDKITSIEEKNFSK